MLPTGTVVPIPRTQARIMDIVVVITIVASLFLVIAAAEPVADTLKLPYSVILACVGLMIGMAATFLLHTEITDAFNPVAETILNLPIRSNTFIYVFLPTLLFQVTLGIDIRRMLDDWVPIIVLAVVAVIVATLIVGYSLYWVGALPLVACLLIGSIVSTTDPSAVVSIFRSISAPRRLSRIIEGESLLNDAAAIALFSLFMGFVVLDQLSPELTDALIQFPLLIVGGAMVGWLAARIAIAIMMRLARFELAQISVSVALPYLSFVAAEQALGASGVIAVVAAGITLNLMGPSRLQPPAWTNLREVWDLLAHWAGALIFILAALLIPRLLEEVRPHDLILVAVVIGAALAARVIILFVLMPLLSRCKLSPVVERSYRVAIVWGGLRGAVTLALALAVTENLYVPAEVKRLVGILATGFTLFTLLAQGTTLRWVIQKLGLDQLSPVDRALSDQVIAVAMQSVRENITTTLGHYRLSNDIVESEAATFARQLDEAVKRAEDNADILDRDRITLGLITLAGAERDTILAHFRERAISARLTERILPDAEQLLETTRARGRLGYLAAARKSLRYERSFRTAVFLHDHLRISRFLAVMTADRFELLLSQRLSVQQLHSFVDQRILRIHGQRVADLLHDILAKRLNMIETVLDGLRLQFPGYAEDIERRFILRTALRLEAQEYNTLRDEGLIGIELHTTLIKDVTARRQAADKRPHLDLALQKSELIRQFPLFSRVDGQTRHLLKRTMATRYVNDGEIILHREGSTRYIFFLALGAVEVESASSRTRLGRGAVFGNMTMLGGDSSQAEVRAIAPSTLLVLDEAQMSQLMEKSASLSEAIHTSPLKASDRP